jgi:uncharacterized membrane protein YfcA
LTKALPVTEGFIVDIWNYQQLIYIALIFIWTGFVRTGLGFGGAALGLPLLLLVGESPVYWLPLIAIHLLFFTSITIKSKSHNIDKKFLKKSLIWIIPPALLGVFGLISFSKNALIIFVFSVSLFYSITWIFEKKISSNGGLIDKILLVVGGYVAGISLTGAPLIVAVVMKQVSKINMRDTLFVLWIILVGIKMATFLLFGIYIDWLFSLMLVPFAFIGHFIGLKTHEKIIQNDKVFKKSIGFALMVVSILGLIKVFI